MPLHIAQVTVSAIRRLAASMRCPHCDDLMVAPVLSEFVDGDEIRHHWQCDACEKTSSTSIPLTSP
jgi:hypothetical protein